MAETSFVNIRRPAPDVAVVTLDRPERLNALSMAVVEPFLAALHEVAEDGETGAVVITGAGRGFCAGGDIKEMSANRAKTLAQRRSDLERMHEIPRLIRSMPQVVVGAINGPAFGAGFAIALTCDLVIASESARFGTAFLKQGLASDFGLSYQLVRLAGPLAARRLVYLDEPLSAAEALAMRLVTEVAPAGELMARAIAVASRLAAQDAEARSSLKRLLAQAEASTHQQMLNEEADAQFALITSPRHAAAVDAFLDARTQAIRPGPSGPSTHR